MIDHPHVGQVAREGCLVALDQSGREKDRRALLAGSVGLSYHSYRYKGRLWALPLDAATQVQAIRPDRLSEAPRRWSDVLELARDGLVSLALRPPHSLMCLMSLAGNVGREPGRPDEDFMTPEFGEPVLEQLAELVAHLDRACFGADPIAVLDELATTEKLACTPLVYGYVSYSRAGFRSHRLCFVDMPCLGHAGPLGSVLGGTGIAVSSMSNDSKAAVDFAWWIASENVQRGLYAGSGGQPGHGMAWKDPNIDAQAGGFFTATRATLEGAMLRPRHDGYMRFQDAAAHLITDDLRQRGNAKQLLDRLNQLWVSCSKPSQR